MSISGPYRACHAHPYGGKMLLHAFLRVPLSVQAPWKSVQHRDRDSFGWGTTLLYIVGSSVAHGRGRRFAQRRNSSDDLG